MSDLFFENDSYDDDSDDEEIQEPSARMECSERSSAQGTKLAHKNKYINKIRDLGI